MRTALLVVSFAVAMAACGRVGFDEGRVAFDAAGDAPPVPRACAIDGVTLFCDDFELPDLAGWDHAVADVARVGTPVRTGTGALRARIATGPEASWVGVAPPSFAAQPAVYLRVWAYVTGDSSLVQANLLTLLNSSTMEELTVLGYGDELRLWRHTSSDEGYAAGAVVQRDRWICIELDVTVDDVAGRIELRMDGTPAITDAGPVDTRVAGELEYLNLGLPWTDTAQGAATVHFDDVHLGTAPVGCGS